MICITKKRSMQKQNNEVNPYFMICIFVLSLIASVHTSIEYSLNAFVILPGKFYIISM